MTEQSVFGNDQDPNPADNNADQAPAASAAQPTIPDALTGLVGEGKKYSSVEAAVSSLPHKELHIGKLEAENEAMRIQLEEAKRELDRASKVDEILNQMSSPSLEQEKGNNNLNSQPLDTAAITDSVLAQLEQRNTQAIAAKNKADVELHMQSKYGLEKSQQMVNAKAAELGVGVDFLMELAAKSPKAFYTQLGVDAQPASPQSVPTDSSVNTESLNMSASPAKDTYSYFQELRKKDPKAWEHPDTQARMFELAREKGSDFYNS